MSVSTGIALIIGNVLPIVFLFFYLSTYTNKLATEIVTGQVRGVPVSPDYRWIMLYQHWLGFACGAMVVALLGALLNLTIARHAPHEDVARVAYVVVFMAGVAFVGWISALFVEMAHYRRVIKQAEAE